MKLSTMKWILAIAFSAASSLALAAGESAEKPMGATGADAGAAGATSFSDLDKNSDGYVDSTEAADVTGLDMSSADTDGDGKLSRTEFEAAMKGGEPSTTPGTSGSGQSN